jgi:aquaporin Z
MKKYTSEFIATYALVFCGTGVGVVNEMSNGVITHTGIAITVGLIVLAMIYAFGDISGAHINPAVTIAFTVAGRMPAKETVPYIVAQLAGAFAASGTLRMMFPASETLSSTIPTGSDLQSFVMEVILTFILMLVILNVSTGAKEKGITAGIAIASVVGLEVMFAGPVSGGSMNPARSLAPAVVSGHLQSAWIYLAAPVLGAVAAVFIARYINKSDPH